MTGDDRLDRAGDDHLDRDDHPDRDDHLDRDDRPLADLDDLDDREELRQRYYGFLQELRVMLPGAQILLAFLLTVPFADRFSDLDELGRRLFGLALAASCLAVVAFLTPTAIHRVGSRQTRRRRLELGLLMARLGLALLGTSLTLALTTVYRMVFGNTTAIIVSVTTALVLIGFWVVVPLSTRRHLPPHED